MNDEIKRKGRGKGKKPALGSITLRIDKDVLAYFKEHYPANVQKAMREVLTKHFKEKQNEN